MNTTRGLLSAQICTTNRQPTGNQQATLKSRPNTSTGATEDEGVGSIRNNRRMPTNKRPLSHVKKSDMRQEIHTSFQKRSFQKTHSRGVTMAPPPHQLLLLLLLLPDCQPKWRVAAPPFPSWQHGRCGPRPRPRALAARVPSWWRQLQTSERVLGWRSKHWPAFRSNICAVPRYSCMAQQTRSAQPVRSKAPECVQDANTEHLNINACQLMLDKINT